MIEYQNIFTQVQVQGPPEWGLDTENDMASERGLKPFFSSLVGWLGNAQIGPDPSWGDRSGQCRDASSCALNIIGINMLAQVDWSIPGILAAGVLAGA